MYTDRALVEDRATRGRNLSALLPRAKTGSAAGSRPTTGSGIGSKAINPFTIFVLFRLP